jgi:hypothetical protein
MGSEVFRFVTVHPPQEVADPTAAVDTTVDLGLAPTPLIDALRAMRLNGARDAMIEASAAYVASVAFIGAPGRIGEPFRDFMAAVAGLPETNFWTGAGHAFTEVFHTTPGAFIRTEAFTTTYARTSDSIVAATIDTTVPARARGLLVRLARALWLIRRLAATRPLTRSAQADAPLVLPAGILPLPDVSVGLRARHREAVAAARVRTEERRQQLTRLTADLAARRQAVDELLAAFERAGARPVATARTASTGVRPTFGFALPETAAAGLSESTRNILRSLGDGNGHVDVARSVTLLERQSAELARRLAADARTGTQMVRLGNQLVPRFNGGLSVLDRPGSALAVVPGPCPPAPVPVPDPTVSVPTGHGDARILGIADLMILEQELLRYELGEIAHIENVLKSETRSRTFKTSHTVEQTLVTEVETTETKEQDLSSSERFELNTESQTVINDNASKSMGLTIHASYGPSVDATANYNSSSSSSRQQSTVASASFAREVTTRAAHRIQTRTLTRRSVRTLDVIEETNEHGFDNKSGNNDIVGVYRFVDKVYKAQVVNYGKRLMLEFIVPEPAAFLRHAMTNHPLDGVSVPKPDRPGNCVDGTFMPLRVEDITRDEYLFWASRYGAQDITPPPTSVTVASGAKKAPESMQTTPSDGERKINSDVLDVAIPDGYLCQTAYVNIYGETQAGLHKVVFQLQEQQGQYVEPSDDGTPFVLTLKPTPTLSVTINSIGFHNYEVLVVVLCTLSLEKYQEWQFKTFTSIMTAYNEAQSRYDQAIAEARFAARDSQIGGTNPRRNRETEQIELKKGCVSQLTGQRFELFDAVSREIAPHGFPEVDFDEARAEGAYIQTFEQSFEWNNMTYVFYPYFWGRKEEWPTIAQLGDDDPLFARFLQAGAARVQVPVRLGFEAGVLTYLATGELWNADGTLVNSDGTTPDPVQVSILDELRSQLGDNSVEGVGRVTVSHNSPNVTGTGTMFTADDEDRRIMIGGRTHVIRSVVDAQNIRLTTGYGGDSASGLGYSLGGRLVGEPWEVKLPTDLVKLDSSLVIR